MAERGFHPNFLQHWAIPFVVDTWLIDDPLFSAATTAGKMRFVWLEAQLLGSLSERNDSWVRLAVRVFSLPERDFGTTLLLEDNIQPEEDS